MPSALYNSFILQKEMVLPKSIPLPVISCLHETNEHIVHGIARNNLFPPDAGLSLVLWCGQCERFEPLQLQNSFLHPSHPFSSSFSGNILVVSVNCRNQFVGPTITMNLWMFRFKLSLWSDYLSKNYYKFNYCRCFLNVSIHKDYNTWNFASL